MTDERQKKTTDEYRDNWDAIFKKKQVTIDEVDHGVYVIEITPKQKEDEPND